MTKYRIEITETLSHTVEMEADSESDAIDKVRQMYRNCEIILDASNYVETEISVKKWKSWAERLFCRKKCLTLQPLIAHYERWQNFVELDSSI